MTKKMRRLPPPSRFERILAAISPKAAGQRYAARVAFDELTGAKRNYDAAAVGGRGAGWRPVNSSADALIERSAPVVRARMRDLARNAPYAAEAIEVWTDYLIGTGIQPRADTGDEDLDQTINDLWAEWSPLADVDGPGGVDALLTIAVRGMIEGGEVFIRRRDRRPEDGLPVPLQLELYEAENLDTAINRNTNGAGPRISQGIEYDLIGRRAAYWLMKDHPASSATIRQTKSSRVSADRIAHLYRRDRVQQRGIPWGVSAIMAMRDFDDWHDAERVRKKIEACLTAFVMNADEGDISAPLLEGAKDESGNDYASDSTGRVVEALEPGSILYLKGNRDVKFNEPKSTGGVSEWSKTQLHQIAAGWGLPYELLTGDLSQVNYSSIRTGMVKFKKRIERFQWSILIPVACQPVWDWFIEAAFLSGRIPVRSAKVKWAPPAFEEIDREKEARADQLEVRNGTMSLSQAIARKGYNPQEVLNELALDLKLLDELGLVLDTDARKLSRAGTSQAMAAGVASETPSSQNE